MYSHGRREAESSCIYVVSMSRLVEGATTIYLHTRLLIPTLIASAFQFSKSAFVLFRRASAFAWCEWLPYGWAVQCGKVHAASVNLYVVDGFWRWKFSEKMNE